MKVSGSKKLVASHLSHRLVAIVCLAVGIAAVKIARYETETQPARFLVRLPPEAETPVQHRDLSEYDVFGEYVEDCSWKSGREKRQCLMVREKARRFINDHWQARKKAYIKVEYYCTGCFPEDHVFIETDENGKWKILIRSFVPYQGYSFHRSFRTSEEVGIL